MATRFTLRQVEYFIAVGELGSIALAAEHLHISAPSISTAIARLEGTFGLSLFVRQPAQALKLTREGRRFLVEAKVLLNQAEALHGVAGTLSGAVRGPLSVGCLVTLAPMVLPALRRAFEQRHSEVAVRQFVGHQAELIERLRDAKLDVALTYEMELPGDLAFEPLAALSPAAILPSRHRLARRDSVTLDELVDEPLILLDLPLSREYFLSLFRAAGLRPNIAERVPDLVVIRSMVANGFGYSLNNVAPRSDRALDGTRLASVALAGEHRPLALGIVHVRHETVPAIVAAFVDHCRERIAADGVPGMARPR